MSVRYLSCGDTAFSVEFGTGIDPAINARVMGLHAAIKAEAAAGRLPGVVETVPSFRALLVHYDPLTTSRAALEPLVASLVAENRAAASVGRAWIVPCCYDDPEFAPDLPEVAARTGHTVEQVIALHTGATFTVYVLGFMPGYPYIGGLPKALELPRRSEPRVRVPKGSVAVAGVMTGVYAWDSPGGWHLIGRTPVAMFDPRRAEPSLYGPGDTTWFRRIGRAEYDALLASQEAGTLDVGRFRVAPGARP
ncbi:MAG: 5-oxoprolinase subunit PxpB [Rhodospirillales bacterium]|nr:MAG: 5-oxoprolinase subunit PxpB [Rhodospirillales bacterium]